MSLHLVSEYRGPDRDLWRVVWHPINQQAILHARQVLSKSEGSADAVSKRTFDVKKSKVVKKHSRKKTYYAKWCVGVLDGKNAKTD